MFKITVCDRGLEPGDLRSLARILAGGGVGVVPTDTVYGLAASALHAEGVARVLRIKGRDASKPPPVLISEIGHARSMAFAETLEAEALMEEFWPGPLTLVMKRRPDGPRTPFQSPDSIALRIPDNPFCLALIDVAGFIVGTSANAAGEPAPSSFEEVTPALLDRVDFAVDGGVCQLRMESTVVDVREGAQVLREGALSEREIRKVISARGNG